MSDIKHYSDEHLNAFIDDQLNMDEKSELLNAMRQDTDLSQRCCKLQKLKNLVQLSYESTEVPLHQQGKSEIEKPARFKWFAVASLLLAMGSVSGWVAHQISNKNGLSDIAELIQHNTGVNYADDWKVMLHVSTSNPTRLNIVLDEAENLLNEYANSSQKLQLEILTNHKGLALVTNSGENYTRRLQLLQNKYPNLMVLACHETLKNLRQTQLDLELLPDTKIVSSALNQIVKRQREGWTYIRI